MDMNASAPSTTGGPEPAEGPLMDLQFIARHQIVERYLAGKLPLRGAQDFERFCGRHPELMDTIGLSHHVNAALRLLEASGKPEPWAQRKPRFYEKPLGFLVLLVAVIALGIAAFLQSSTHARDAKEISGLRRQLAELPLQPAATTRDVLLMPSRTAPSTRPQAVLNGRAAEFADLKIDVSWSAFTAFRVLIDRVGQGRFAVIGNLLRDSNGQLRLGLNATGLGPGEYQFTIEGVDWRGNAQPQGWVSVAVVRGAAAQP